METIKYKVCWGEHSYAGDAQQVADEIKSIGEEVKPVQIVDFARSNPQSELHKCFTWDNDVAAEKYRLYEARHIVANLKIIYINDEKEEVKTHVRFMQRNETSPNAGFKETVKMISDFDEREKLLNVAIFELKQFERKYKDLTELQDVFDAIDAL